MNQSFQIGVIADDFTGAMDAGVQFARYGLETAFAVTAYPASRVVILNTASREVDPETARARCASAAEQFNGRLRFKKIDSTLRGHLAAELHGLIDAAGGVKIVVCPAAPAVGRVVQNGILTINGVPLHETAFKNDPAFPATTPVVYERIGLPATHLGLTLVRGPLEDMVRAIQDASTTVITTDGVTEADLFSVSQAIIRTGSIPCGALGLANAWAQALTGRDPVAAGFKTSQSGAPFLVVAGSANASAHAQVARLADHSQSLICQINVPLDAAGEVALYQAVWQAWDSARAVVLCPAAQETIRTPEWLAFGQTIARAAAEIIRQRRPSGLIIAGGETANHLCGLLAVETVHLIGEAAPGIPFGQLIGGQADRLLLLTKAGGFGHPDSLEKIIYG